MNSRIFLRLVATANALREFEAYRREHEPALAAKRITFFVWPSCLGGLL